MVKFLLEEAQLFSGLEYSDIPLMGHQVEASYQQLPLLLHVLGKTLDTLYIFYLFNKETLTIYVQIWSQRCFVYIKICCALL